MLPRSLQGTIGALYRLLTPAVVLSLWLAVTPAWAGSMLLLGAGGAGGGALPGPPVFTFTDIEAGSTSTNTCTSNALAIGAANSNRRVYVLATDASTGASPQAATGASFNSGAISADVFQVIGTTATDAMNTYLISAVVPTGTTATVTLTYASATFSGAAFAAYTVNTTQLNSINPVTTAQSVVTSATANPVSANTFGIAIATSGSAILASFHAFGGSFSNGTQSFTSSDASVSTDGLFGSAMAGHANSAAVSGSSHVNTGWTGSSDSLLALAVLR